MSHAITVTLLCARFCLPLLQISIKIATRHQSEDLAPNALNNLARLVERFDMQDGR